MKTGIKSFIVKNHYLVIAVLCFLVGGVLALMCLIQKIPLIFGVMGVFGTVDINLMLEKFSPWQKEQ